MVTLYPTHKFVLIPMSTLYLRQFRMVSYVAIRMTLLICIGHNQHRALS